MKKFLKILILAGVAAGIFYFPKLERFFQGIKPAIFPPPADIAGPSFNDTGLPLNLPPGFSVSIFAKDLSNPRVIVRDPAGRLVVSIPGEGSVVALPDDNVDFKADSGITLVKNLNRPHGLAFHCEGSADVQKCKLYVAESNQVTVYDYDQGVAQASNGKKIIDLPGGGGHFTRTLLIHNNKLLISVGSSCNVCNEKDFRRAKVLSANLDGTDLKVFASGLRNAVFLATHPAIEKVWVTEMGRDLIGDDIPPDEINILEEGRDYGWPFCYGKNILDVYFDQNADCSGKIPSQIDLQAHSAPLGLAFVPGEGWPKEYQNDLLVAYHGSWNRSLPTGYKIVRIKLDEEGKYLGTEDFITGWLAISGALGRPVDILAEPDGVLYISDDKAGVIYRVSYKSGEGKVETPEVKLTSPELNALVRSPLAVTGQARGFWFFEASFPVELEDGNGKQIAIAPATAQGEWMTAEFVSFKAVLEFSEPSTDTGTLILRKDNPSGLPEHDAQLRVPVRFR